MKVYLVMDVVDNNETYEDSWWEETRVVAVCATYEKAKETIDNFVPDMLEEQSYEDQEGKTVVVPVTYTETDTWRKHIRAVNEDDGCWTYTHALYIEEMEVLET